MNNNNIDVDNAMFIENRVQLFALNLVGFVISTIKCKIVLENKF